jgi:hypothetical protein
MHQSVDAVQDEPHALAFQELKQARALQGDPGRGLPRSDRASEPI